MGNGWRNEWSIPLTFRVILLGHYSSVRGTQWRLSFCFRSMEQATVSGRETSVSLTFHFELFQACLEAGAIDLNVPLNGADRVFNADYMFSSNDQFFLIEFKSSRGGLSSEDHKESACNLCHELYEEDVALQLHRHCHFAMWGHKAYRGGLDTFFGVYENLVCRPKILPSCEAVYSIPYKDGFVEHTGEELARAVANKKCGLNQVQFVAYLQWLLWARKGDTKKRELPITLFGTSFAGGVKSREFKSFDQLELWAAPFMANYVAPADSQPESDDPEPDSPKPSRGPSM